MKKIRILLLICWGMSLRVFSQEIVLWHAFEGFLASVFEEIVEDFNHHSGHYKIIPIHKGNYSQIIQQALNDFNQDRHPHILQVYEVATLSMMHQERCFYPVGDLMGKFNKKFDPDVYIDVIRKFYSAPNGKMMSLPWNASTGILFYNKTLFKKAGLDPQAPPKTWEELEALGKVLVQAGYQGFTTAWPAAYHLEHFSCWHNLPFSTGKNGFEKAEARFIFNDDIRNYHLSKLVHWSQEGIFSYQGRLTAEPEQQFARQNIAILLQGANRFQILQKQVDFEIGVGYMPYWKKFVSSPYNLNIGGGSFWVMKGFSDEEYRGVSQFFEYLSSAEVQAFWHQKTYYLPITDAAYLLTKKKGFYEKHPAAEIAVLEVMQNAPTDFSIGMRFGNYMPIREVFIDELEQAFSGKLSPKAALDHAVQKGNLLLEEFEKTLPTS